MLTTGINRVTKGARRAQDDSDGRLDAEGG